MTRDAVPLLTSAALSAALAIAQPSFTPPPVLRVVQEDVKEGKGAAHEKSEAAFMQAAARVKYRTNILGLTAMSGTSHALFVQGLSSIASIVESQAGLDTPEFAALDAIDSQLFSSRRSLIAIYRSDLSYGADKINLPKTRFFSIETVRVREGHLQAYTQLVRMLVDAAGKSGDPGSVATYQVVSGAPNGSYLVLTPMASLKSMDENRQRQLARSQAMGEDGRKRYTEALAEAVAGEESILYAVNPQMSYVPAEWIKADPDFWTPKPVQTEKPPSKAPAKKPTSK